MNSLVLHVRNPKETFYGRILLIAGAAIWIGLCGLILANPLLGALLVAYGLLIAIVFWVAQCLYRAYIFGHYVLIGPQQFPRLHQMVLDGATALGLKEPPLAFVFNSHGVMNAFAVRMFGRPYIWITSAIIDADNDAQIRFVIGHELAHHAAGHLGGWKNLVKLPGHLVPLLGAAYSRACELTCDRVGAYLCRDLNAARGAVQMLAAGSAKLNVAMNTDAFEAQEPTVPAVAGFVLHIFSPYPRLTRRVVELSNYYTRRASQASRVAANPRAGTITP
jgi:Zn-dependent protease with chaperone function